MSTVVKTSTTAKILRIALLIISFAIPVSRCFFTTCLKEPNSISENLRYDAPRGIVVGTMVGQLAVITAQLVLFRADHFAPTAFLLSLPFITTPDGEGFLYNALHTASFLASFVLWTLISQPGTTRRVAVFAVFGTFVIAMYAKLGYIAVALEALAIGLAFIQV